MSTQRVIHGATAQYIQSLLQQVGQAPTLETGSDGTPVLRSATGGWRYALFFFKGDQEADFSSMQFNAGFEAAGSLAKTANDWNMNWRFSKALAVNDKLIVLQLDTILRGVTEAHVRHSIALWEAAISRFGQDLYRR
ncbi:MAG: YbjN domain-containing protein [Alphaproteobacteria bacterium]|nr:YbjN domain-containing protein [Alphaproteobacteria bacterium]